MASTAGCLFLWPAVLLRQVQHSVSACSRTASRGKEGCRACGCNMMPVGHPCFTVHRHQLCGIHAISSVA